MADQEDQEQIFNDDQSGNNFSQSQEIFDTVVVKNIEIQDQQQSKKKKRTKKNKKSEPEQLQQQDKNKKQEIQNIENLQNTENLLLLSNKIEYNNNNNTIISDNNDQSNNNSGGSILVNGNYKMSQEINNNNNDDSDNNDKGYNIDVLTPVNNNNNSIDNQNLNLSQSQRNGKQQKKLSVSFYEEGDSNKQLLLNNISNNNNEIIIDNFINNKNSNNNINYDDIVEQQQKKLIDRNSDNNNGLQLQQQQLSQFTNHNSDRSRKNSENNFDYTLSNRQESNAQEELKDEVLDTQKTLFNDEVEMVRSFKQYIANTRTDGKEGDEGEQVPPVKNYFQSEKGQNEFHDFLENYYKDIEEKKKSDILRQDLFKIQICVLIPSESQRDYGNVQKFLYSKLSQNKLSDLFKDEKHAQEKDNYLEYVPQHQLAQKNIQEIKNTLGFDTFYFEGKYEIPIQYFQDIHFPEGKKKPAKFIIFLNSKDTNYHNTAYPSYKKIVFIKEPREQNQNQINLSSDDVVIYRYTCKNKNCNIKFEQASHQHSQQLQKNQDNISNNQNQNGIMQKQSSQGDDPNKQTHPSQFKKQFQLQEQKPLQQFDQIYSKHLNPEQKCNLCKELAEYQKFYVFKHRLQHLEDENLDYKYYNLRKQENIDIIAKFACSCLNKDHFSDEAIAGTLVVGIKDNPPEGQQQRIVCQGLDLSDTEFEHFKNSLHNTINKITTIYQQDPQFQKNKPTDQVFKNYFNLKKCEILHYDRKNKNVSSLYQYDPFLHQFTKKCIIELQIKRISVVVKDPVVLLLQDKKQHNKRIFCKRVLDSSSKVNGGDEVHQELHKDSNFNFITRDNLNYNPEQKVITYETVSQTVQIKQLTNSLQEQKVQNQLLSQKLEEIKEQIGSAQFLDDETSGAQMGLQIFDLSEQHEDLTDIDIQPNGIKKLNSKSNSAKTDKRHGEKILYNHNTQNPKEIQSNIDYYNKKIKQLKESYKKHMKQKWYQQIIEWVKVEPISKSLFIFTIISYLLFRKKINSK